ncbi:hypothetical protein [Mesorhizobium sp. ISC11]|uniref:hypothetical protein n=1 Tax=Mesorhizobium sp. ISC11 TaxID=3076428 RepID=UPI00301E31F3
MAVECGRHKLTMFGHIAWSRARRIGSKKIAITGASFASLPLREGESPMPGHLPCYVVFGFDLSHCPVGVAWQPAVTYAAERNRTFATLHARDVFHD